MDPIIHCFNSVVPLLRDAKTYDDVKRVLRDIDNLDAHLNLFEQYHKQDMYIPELYSSANEVVDLLIKVFVATKDVTLQKMIIKSMLKPGLCMNYPSIEMLLDNYSSALGSESLRIYAWLQNFKFINKFGLMLPSNLQIHKMFVGASLKYADDSRFFETAIENYITAYDTKVVTINEPFLASVVFTNLENSHRNVHKLLLMLFKRLVSCYNPKSIDDQQMITDVVVLPWNNRNKYLLLAHLVSSDLLLKHPKFDSEIFLKGLQMGLTMHHLMGASGTLVKALHNHPSFSQGLLEMIGDLLWKEDEHQVKNIIKYWLSSLSQPFIDQLYKKISSCVVFDIPTTSGKFFRLVIIRNAFKRTFKEPLFDARIIDFATTIDDMAVKIEILYILVEIVNAESDARKQLEYILALLNFLRFNMCLEDSTFVDNHVLRKLPDFFNLLATMRFRTVQVQKEIFGIIRDDIYQQGIDFGSYESVSFSLKMLNVILKQYCGVSSGTRLSKSTNIDGNLGFGKYLRDNEIWNFTSRTVFLQLVKLVDECENSDLSEMAARILVEYFIKTKLATNIEMENGASFTDWLSEKVEEAFNHREIASALGAKRYFVLKFESALSNNSADHELKCFLDELKSRFTKMKQDADPAKSMGEGLHLFNFMDSINYGLKRLDATEAKSKLIPVIKVLIKLIAYHFLDFISEPSVRTSFDILDEKLLGLIERSVWQEDANIVESKSKLLLFIWYTLRSCSELSETLANIATTAMDPSDKEYSQVMTTCVDVNIQILIRSCHKGAIESASEIIGRITKRISQSYANLYNKSTDAAKNLHALLVTLKREIDCGKRSPDGIGEIRCVRGLLLMSQHIISNHPPFLKFLVESLLIIPVIHSFEDTKSIQFVSNIKPVQLHLLAALIKIGSLVDDMLKFYDFILCATFKAYKESSTDFVKVNALLQIIGAIVPKLSNQNSHMMVDEESKAARYEPKAVTVYEFYVKITYAFRIALFDLSYNRSSLSATYIIILLQILSNFECRSEAEHWSEMDILCDTFPELKGHECEKIRILAARCYAQWLKTDKNMLTKINRRVEDIFSDDGNCVQFAVVSIRIMISRYENCLKGIEDFDCDAFKTSLRGKIAKKFKRQKLVGAYNFYIRYHLLEFLTFLDFEMNHEVVQSLILEKGLKNFFGYSLWREKIQEIQEK